MEKAKTENFNVPSVYYSQSNFRRDEEDDESADMMRSKTLKKKRFAFLRGFSFYKDETGGQSK